MISGKKRAAYDLDTSLGLMQQAWRWADRAQLSYWDALILAAAEALRITVSIGLEDFQSKPAN